MQDKGYYNGENILYNKIRRCVFICYKMHILNVMFNFILCSPFNTDVSLEFYFKSVEIMFRFLFLYSKI